jgi:hypothetical protein
MENKITTLHALGCDLLSVYEELRSGSIDQKTADSLANVAGKVVNTLKVQLEYNMYKSKIDKIPLLESKVLTKVMIGNKGE